MIRCFVQNVRHFLGSKHFLQPHTSQSIIKRLKSSELIEKAKKVEKSEDEQMEKLKRYRLAEVHLWHGLNYESIDPEFLTEDQLQHLCGLDAKHQRKRYCRFLLVRMEAKAEQKAKKQAAKEAKSGLREQVQATRASNPHIVYGVGHNSQFLRINNQLINKWINRKMFRSKLYGQKLVIDLSFENHMTDLERSKLSSGLRRVYAENRAHKKPMDLHLCGVPPDSVVLKSLCGQIPTLLSKKSPTEIHSECFTELFPKERLVMLTLDSDNVLEYNFDDIYIIGGIVDFGRNEPLTMAKAKIMGIRTARLPLDNMRLKAGDSRELPMSSVAAFIREHQVNRNLKEIIEKCVYLYSKKGKLIKEVEERRRTKHEATHKTPED
ncbi:mitochondrial ribonuclease P protein 1 homolog [Contarinia nasturtii]|uniref:mitochondrial ribonuclease P protein 1 homolog n=1 Tax=Contarinia nasturtii TaxID=265458 RepID=UPI0012D3A074|nr:mitochondrial ribonuclease P protein 1 homolog [Contarinia nasturtii]